MPETKRVIFPVIIFRQGDRSDVELEFAVIANHVSAQNLPEPVERVRIIGRTKPARRRERKIPGAERHADLRVDVETLPDGGRENRVSADHRPVKIDVVNGFAPADAFEARLKGKISVFEK